MSPDEFFSALGTLCGSGHGMLARSTRLFPFSRNTLKAISRGERQVPAKYAEAVRHALADSERLGSLFELVQPRLESLVRDAGPLGYDGRAVASAVAAWAALRLTGAVQAGE